MNDDFEKLAVLLAASGFNERAIYNALIGVERYGAEYIVDRVRLIRRELLGNVPDASINERYIEESRDRGQAQLVEQVMRLVRESKLSPTEAASRLTTSIMQGKERTYHIPSFRRKDGFRDWLMRVSELVPPSELLHYATMMRNEIVHLRPTDWPLRERGK